MKRKDINVQLQRSDYIIAILAFIYSILLCFNLIDGMCGKGNSKINYWLYFTNDSNLFVLLWLLFLSCATFAKNKKILNFVKNRTLMVCIGTYIFLTFIIVALLLSPIYSGLWFDDGISGAKNVFFTHLITPVVYFIFLVFVKSDEKFSWKYNFYTISYPAIWFFPIILPLGLTKTLGFGGYDDGSIMYYPYGFLDPGQNGMCKGNIFIYLLIIVILIGVIYGIGMLIGFIKTKIDKAIFKK